MGAPQQQREFLQALLDARGNGEISLDADAAKCCG